MTTIDNQFAILTSGASDWDTDLDANFGIIERGYHVTQQAGIAINTGQVLQIDSSGFFHQFNPNTPSNAPAALAFTAAASGDTLKALAWGIVRSLAINSAILPGQPAWVSAATPGLLVGSSGVESIPVGVGLPNGGILFAPSYTAVGGGGGGGVTHITSLSDVDPSGLANNSILKWSNASSKFTMQVDSAGGGGGGTVGSAPTIVQTGFIHGTSTTNNQVTLTTTPVVGNLLLFLAVSNSFLVPHDPGLGVELSQLGQLVNAGFNSGVATLMVYSRLVQTGDGKVWGWANTDGDDVSIYAMEINGAGNFSIRGGTTGATTNSASGSVSGPLAKTSLGNALAYSFLGANNNVASSTITGAGWNLAHSAAGGSFGGSYMLAVRSGGLAKNVFDIPQFNLNLGAANQKYPMATIVIEPTGP